MNTGQDDTYSKVRAALTVARVDIPTEAVLALIRAAKEAPADKGHVLVTLDKHGFAIEPHPWKHYLPVETLRAAWPVVRGVVA